MVKYCIGIDIGSTSAKTIVMNAEGEILERLLQPTGWSSLDTAQSIRSQLTEKGISSYDMQKDYEADKTLKWED